MDLATLHEVLLKMGYQCITMEGDSRAYTFPGVVDPIFILIREDTELSKEDIQELFDDHGINPDVFHSILESL